MSSIILYPLLGFISSLPNNKVFKSLAYILALISVFVLAGIVIYSDMFLTSKSEEAVLSGCIVLLYTSLISQKNKSTDKFILMGLPLLFINDDPYLRMGLFYLFFTVICAFKHNKMLKIYPLVLLFLIFFTLYQVDAKSISFSLVTYVFTLSLIGAAYSRENTGILPLIMIYLMSSLSESSLILLNEAMQMIPYLILVIVGCMILIRKHLFMGLHFLLALSVTASLETSMAMIIYTTIMLQVNLLKSRQGDKGSGLSYIPGFTVITMVIVIVNQLRLVNEWYFIIGVLTLFFFLPRFLKSNQFLNIKLNRIEASIVFTLSIINISIMWVQ
jgi:hypothetical protein